MHRAPVIVVGVDHSDVSARALRFAAAEADRRGARLEVLWAWGDSPASGGRDGAVDAVELQSWARRELETLVVDVLGELEPATVVVAVPDTPVDALVRSGRHADLLVVGARGAGGFAGLRLGSVSRRVAARASCPVVIVPAASADDDAGADGTTGPQIAVGVDGSDTAQAALRWALEAAPMWDASVLAVHGWGPPPAPSPQLAYLAAATEAIGRRAAMITDAAVELAAATSPDVTVTSESVPTSAASALVAASRDASLVVVGSRGLGRLAGALLGSVTQQIAGHASCPVVVVPSGWRPAEDRDASAEPSAPEQEPAEDARRVVVGIDSSAPSEGLVLTTAAAEARLRDARLDVVSVWTYPPMSSEERMMVSAEQVGSEAQLVAARHVDDVLGPQDQRDLEVRLNVLRGAPVRALLDAAEHSELLVVGRRDKSRLRHLLLGSVADQCVRHASCPTMIVPHAEDAGTWEGPIVVGVDGSSNSLHALEWAGNAATLHRLPLIVVSAWAVPALDPSATVAGVPDMDRAEADALEQLDAWTATAVSADVEVTLRVRWGNPAEAILGEAATASMVVVGARGRGGFAGLVLGSASREIVHRAPCPVVVLPPPPETDPAA